MALKSRTSPTRFMALAFCAHLAACAGDLDDPARFVDALAPATGSGKVDAHASRDAALPGDASCSVASAKNVPKDVFIPACATAGCHNPIDLAGSLDLKSSDVASRLVGVQAHDGPGLYVATNGDPATSDLYLLLTPSFPFDNQMPLGLPPLDASTLACVRAWVTEQARSVTAGFALAPRGRTLTPCSRSPDALFRPSPPWLCSSRAAARRAEPALRAARTTRA
jgi:hypothetical protein